MTARFRKQNNQKSSGFTMTELMVVSSIITLLGAVIYPVFAKTKEAALKGYCISNAKQLALASIMYSADYDDHIVLDSYFLGDDQFAFGTGKYIAWWGSRDYRMDPQVDMTEGALQPYMRNVPILECPSAREIPLNLIGNAVGYGINRELQNDLFILKDINTFDFEIIVRSVSMSEIQNPPETIFVADAATINFDKILQKPQTLTYGRRSQPTVCHGRHNGLATVAWMDGHAQPQHVTLRTQSDAPGTQFELTPEFHKKHNTGDVLKYPRDYANASAFFLSPRDLYYLWLNKEQAQVP